MGRHFKKYLSLSQSWLKFKILETTGDFAKNLAQNWSDWYMNGSLILEKLVFVWSTFQFDGGTSLLRVEWVTLLRFLFGMHPY